ncbi:MAG: glycosyltransferase family 4 protein [Fervidobacterium sp.]|uniref:glycosyltransferase family 4 protein n=1 Tax=Fervidobacterium sp. TaxID=1871331 RepID=UPI00404B974F
MNISIISVDNSKQIKLGGKHVHQELLERGLKDLGHKVTVFYPPVETNVFKHRISLLMFSLVNTKYLFSSRLRILSTKANILRFIRFFKKIDYDGFDIVHSHDVVSAYGVDVQNLVLTIHGYFTRELFDYSRKFEIHTDKDLYEWLMNIEREGIKKAKRIIAVDSRIKDYLINEFGVDEERISVIYNAIDDKAFAPVNDDEKRGIRKRLSLPEDAFIVLLPRRFEPKNGVLYAAEAFSKLKGSEYFFVIAGSGSLKDEMIQILKGNRNYVLLEALPHEKIIDYYKACDMVLVPSVTSNDIEEATSLSMLEGMSCGKVTVCTKVGGMKEVIKHMENGILIEQKDVQAIIDAIKYVKENYEHLDYMRKNAREYVVENHGYLNYAKRIIDIYKEVLGEGSGGIYK